MILYDIDSWLGIMSMLFLLKMWSYLLYDIHHGLGSMLFFGGCNDVHIGLERFGLVLC